MTGILGRVQTAGDARAIGRALGQAGRGGMPRIMAHPLWADVAGPRHAAAVMRMAEATRALFPGIWDEIAGLAEGLDLPAHQVFAWNCRGDLLATVPDGCTTVMLPGAHPVIAHNEDGFPFLSGLCFLAEMRPDDAPALMAFCYPGSVPGHTFAANCAGLAQAVNNLRLRGVVPEIPRMVLGRAVLAARSFDAAVALLRAAPASGGFHFALAQGPRLLSVEFGGGRVSAQEMTAPTVHANHALYLPAPGQVVTQSSADRQARAAHLLAVGADPMDILRDSDGVGLPILRRASDDPDEENTHATALLRLAGGGVDWQVHHAGPVLTGRLASHE